MDLAPIALFVYNRPEHTRQTVDNLLNDYLAKYSDLYIFADGPKREGAPGVAEVREYIRTIRGFRSVRIVESERNLGLSNSLTRHIGQVCAEHGRIIVLEDDHSVSPHFLNFMNDALAYYRDRDEVVCISGYTYPVEYGPEAGELPDTFFLRGIDCWGFGTWRRGWAYYEPDARKLMDELRRRGLEWEFDRKGSFPYTRMLQDAIEGRVDSWAIRWLASTFLHGKLALYPRHSLVRNTGLDGSGAHGGSTNVYDTIPHDKPIAITPIPVEEDPDYLERLAAFFRKAHPPRTLTLDQALALAEQLATGGRQAEARQLLGQILQALPGHPVAQEMLRRIGGA